MSTPSVRSEIGKEFRRTMPWIAAALLAVAVIVGGGVLVTYLVIQTSVNGSGPPQSLTDPRIPTAAHGYATMQVLDCVRQGPDCAEFDQAKEYLQKSSTQDGGITYTALNEDGTPGAASHVFFTAGTADQEYRAFADAVTGNGHISTRTVLDTDFEQTESGEGGQTATFTVPDAARPTTGRYEFTPVGDVMALRSITFTEGR